MTSIQRRLTLGLGAVCCLLWSVGGIALYWILRAGLLAEFDRALQANTEALTLQTEQTRTGFVFDSAGDFMRAFERAERPDYFQIWVTDGATLVRSTSLQERDLPRRAGPRDAPLVWSLALADGVPGRAIGVHFLPPVDDEAPPQSRSEVTLVVARDRTTLDRRLDWLAMTLLLVGAGMVVVMAFLVAAVVRRGLQPLSGLAERAATIDASSLQLRFPTDNMPAELLPIGQRLNDLLARLEASFARERRFSADVAHELRTPIAELRALSEVALKWPDDAAATRSTLQDALAIALQMEFVATRLLALARCEAGLLPVHTERVSVATLIEEVLQPLAAEARAKKLSISIEVPADTYWFTDPAALRSILTNLLSNAVEHGPAAGAIRVRVESNGVSERLLVSNTADNLAPEDLPHLFERFWRKDAARSSNAHCGVGLALAKAYAQSVGLELHAELNNPREITLVLAGAQRWRLDPSPVSARVP